LRERTVNGIDSELLSMAKLISNQLLCIIL